MRKDIENYNISLQNEIQKISDEALKTEITRRISVFQNVTSKYSSTLQEALITLNREGKGQEILEIKIAIAELQDAYDIVHKKGIENVVIEDLILP